MSQELRRIPGARDDRGGGDAESTASGPHEHPPEVGCGRVVAVPASPSHPPPDPPLSPTSFSKTDGNDGGDGGGGSFDLPHESNLLLSIAIPTVAVQLSTFLLFPLTASSLGRRLGAEELAGFSLASMTGNLTCLSVILGILSAGETLQPRAYGAGEGHRAEVGRLAVRGFAACALALGAVAVPLWTVLRDALIALGQDEAVATLASRWVRTYLFGVPSVLLFRVLQRFLSCQGIVWPVAYGGALGCLVVHPLLLRWAVPRYGFVGSGVAVSLSQTVQCAAVLAYLRFLRPHDPETWPGMTREVLRESLGLRPMIRYVKLGFGGVLSMTEWWFWEVVCFIAGKFGVKALCIHTVVYQLIPLLFMLPLGLSIGMSVRIGHILERDVDKAKKIAVLTMGCAVVLMSAVAVGVYAYRMVIISIFTEDEEVVEGCLRIWPKMSIYIPFITIFCISSGILKALALQWTVAVIVFACNWCLAIPAILYFAVRQGGGVDAIWSVMPFAYAFMDLVFFIAIYSADWKAIGDKARKRRKLSILQEWGGADEGTSLLQSDKGAGTAPYV